MLYVFFSVHASQHFVGCCLRGVGSHRPPFRSDRRGDSPSSSMAASKPTRNADTCRQRQRRPKGDRRAVETMRNVFDVVIFLYQRVPSFKVLCSVETWGRRKQCTRIVKYLGTVAKRTCCRRREGIKEGTPMPVNTWIIHHKDDFSVRTGVIISSIFIHCSRCKRT